MHICTIIPTYLPLIGGAEVGIHSVLKYLATTTDHRFTVVTPALTPNVPTSEIINGIEVIRYWQPKVWANWYAPTLAAFLSIPPIINQLRPDLLHICYILPSGIAASYAAVLQKIPYIYNLGGHDIYDPIHMPPALLRAWAAHWIRQAPLILAYSNWAKNYLVSKYAASSDAVRVVNFGFPLDEFALASPTHGDSVRHKHQIQEDTVLIFALQRLEARKGIDVLLKALALLKNVNFHCLIGGKGSQQALVRSLILEYGLEQKVTLCGFISDEDKSAYYAACDIFALHTYHEGFGIVLAEAAACGKPSVTTDAGGTTDIVIHNQTGFTVPPGQPAALADALHTLISNPELRNKFGQQALEHSKRFAIPYVASRYLELFKSARQRKT